MRWCPQVVQTSLASGSKARRGRSLDQVFNDLKIALRAIHPHCNHRWLDGNARSTERCAPAVDTASCIEQLIRRSMDLAELEVAQSACSGDQVMKQCLGSRNSVLCVPLGNTTRDLYDQCTRKRERASSQDHSNLKREATSPATLLRASCYG